MRFWWVNQGDSFEEARKLGALWAPLEDKAGHKQPSWETLDEVQVGDLVFHYANKKVRGISSAISSSRTAQIRIRDRGQWQELGREIEVEPQEFDFSVDLSEIPLDLRANSGNGIATPFDKTGKVKQGYMFSLPSPVARFILGSLNLLEAEEGQDLEASVTHIFGTFTEGTDKEVAGVFRREQRALRAHLLGGKTQDHCSFCGRLLPSNLLVAAHIKPRNACSERERLDPNVVIWACVLGCDSLYDKGVVFVDDKGILRATSGRSGTPDLSDFVSDLVGRHVSRHTTQTAKYFAWHSKHVAKK